MTRVLVLTGVVLIAVSILHRLPPRLHMLFPLLFLPPRFRVLAIAAVLVVVGFSALLPGLRGERRPRSGRNIGSESLSGGGRRQ